MHSNSLLLIILLLLSGLFVFKTGSLISQAHCVAKNDLKLLIPCLHFPNSRTEWGHRYYSLSFQFIMENFKQIQILKNIFIYVPQYVSPAAITIWWFCFFHSHFFQWAIFRKLISFSMAIMLFLCASILLIPSNKRI